MGGSVLKTLIIYVVILVIATAIIFKFVLIPAHVHYMLNHVPGTYDTLYLSAYSPYNTIIVEVDHQPGMEPDSKAIQFLQQQIEWYSGKDVVIHVSDDIKEDEVPDIIIGKDIFSVASDLQNAHRDYRTGWLAGNITLYVMYLDTVWHPDSADYSEDIQAHLAHKTTSKVYSVGVTYAADSIIIFKGSIVNEDLETTILLHELGHIWGLRHSNESDNVMNSEFNVFNGTLGKHNSKILEFPKEFSNRDKEKLARLHMSRHNIPNYYYLFQSALKLS